MTAFADRKKRLAVARLRCSLSITSTRAPSRSIARYRTSTDRGPEYTSRGVPATADFARSTSAQLFRQYGRELRLPITNRFIGEHEAADQEHLSQISQTEFVAEPPKYHERYQSLGYCVLFSRPPLRSLNSFGAVQTTEPAIALRGAFSSLPDGRRSAFRTTHVTSPPQPERS